MWANSTTYQIFWVILLHCIHSKCQEKYQTTHFHMDMVMLYTATYCAIWLGHLVTTGKYETIGSLSVSAILVAGSIGIGIHSFDLLLDIWSHHHSQAAQTLSDTVASTVTTASDHVNQQQNVLDPNAAWFALASVAIKEWLYRISKCTWTSSANDCGWTESFNVYAATCIDQLAPYSPFSLYSSQSGPKWAQRCPSCKCMVYK